MVNKSRSAFRTIAEVGREIGVATHVLRFWETKFPQISPMKTSGGRRYYRPDDVELIRLIRDFLYEKRYTIEGVQKLLKEHGVKAFLNGDIQKDFFDISTSEEVSSSVNAQQKIFELNQVNVSQVETLKNIKSDLLDLKVNLKDLLAS